MDDSRELSTSHELWWTMVILSITMFILLAFSFPFLEPGSGSYVIALLVAVILGITLFGSALLIFIGWEPF